MIAPARLPSMTRPTRPRWRAPLDLTFKEFNPSLLAQLPAGSCHLLQVAGATTASLVSVTPGGYTRDLGV